MLEKYLRPGITKPRLLKLLTCIGELKTCPFPLLKTVKNPITEKVATRKLIDSLLTDSLLGLTGIGNLTLTVKSRDLLKSYKLPYKHIIRDPDDSASEHRAELREFLYPLMFSDSYHAVVYKYFDRHELKPDACLILKHDNGYQIKFIEIERTDKGSNYLLDKRDKYISLGTDESTWSGWWYRTSDDLKLPYCSKEQFCFSVLCKGKKTFDWEGWEWLKN